MWVKYHDNLHLPLNSGRMNEVASTSKLDEPSRIFQQYQQAFQEWDDTRKKIIGTADKPNTLAYFEARLDAIKTVESRLKENLEKRLQITKRIYEQIKLAHV